MEQKIISLIKMGFELDDFYSISFNNHGIFLQGSISDELIVKYMKKGYVFDFRTDRYIYESKDLNITFI